MKKKKILFVVPSLTIGGMERMQVTLANALCRRGYDITILTLSHDLKLKDQIDSKVIFKCVEQRKFPLLSRIKLIWTFYEEGMWETRSSPKKLHRYYIGNDKYDIEIAFFRGLPVKIVSGSYIEPEKTQMFAWVHSDFENAVGYDNNFKSMDQVFQSYSRFKKVICVSKQVEESFKRVIGDTGNLTTIYNMLPIQDIINQAKEKCRIPTIRHAFNIVMVGRLVDDIKGDLRLISVIASLQREGFDVGLVLVGDGPDRKKIEETIREMNASDYVELVGMQNNPYPYMRQADLAVCASFFEGYNLTVAEAMICGTPVLSTNCTGPNEILDEGKYGMLVENSEFGLREGIRKMIQKPDLLEHYRKMGKERIPFFSEETILNQIENLWN